MSESLKELWFSVSGLDFVRATISGEVSMGGMADTMGMEMLEADFGHLLIGATPDERHLNPAGLVHGGFAATVLDTVTGVVVQTMLDPGQSCVTVDLQTQLIKPLPKGLRVFAQGHVTRRTRQLAFTRGDLKDENGDVYAHAQATVMILEGLSSKANP